MKWTRLLVSLVFLLAVIPAQAAQNLLFIMDASGSMWGQVEGQSKIAVAREVMTDLVAELPDDARAGLVAYGHNRKGDCSDIETLRPLGPLDRQGLIGQIEGLNPKGKTPITATVRHVVQELRTLEEPTSVVLVSDGLESCGGDPCAAVREAREAGIDFRMHVVGFDLGEADTAQLQCMAEAADGRYYEAANATELAEALQEAVQVSPGLRLEVTANGNPTSARVFAHRAGEGDVHARFEIAGHAEGNPRLLELPAGRYDIRVAATEIAGAPEKRFDDLVIPEKGETSRQVDFSDGRLVLRVTSNGEPLEARSYVYDARTDKEVDRDRTDDAGEALYRLGPGTYRVKVLPDGIDAPERLIENVQINIGETVTRTVGYASGRAEITVTANGDPLEARTYIIDARTEKEAARARTDDQGVAGYDIPTGTYFIRVNPDGIDAPEREIEDVVITAGETTEVATDYASGRAEITVTANGEPLEARTYIIDARTEKEAARARTDDQGVAGYDIPTGTYFIRVNPDGIDAPEREIEDVVITAGETTEVATDYASGRAEITVTANGEPLEARTYIIDARTEKEAARARTNDQGVAG
ncbi:MAG: VWA domain-containing protein, partial [Pseudomonadota bacterium]